MSIEIAIPLCACLIAILAAIYARWSANEAKEANDIGRLNALLALSLHYQERMNHQAKLTDSSQYIPGTSDAAMKAYIELDRKLSEVNFELIKYHSRLVKRRD